MIREQIEEKYKWNLDDIYSSWQTWEADVTRMQELMQKIPTFKGKIKESPIDFVELMTLEEELSKTLDKVYLYPYMMKDLNSKDQIASVKLQEIQAIYNAYSISTAWITPEILEIPQEIMTQWIIEYPALKPYEFSLMETYRLQRHVLSAEKEKLLSYFGQYQGAPSTIYGELSTTDIKWNIVKFSDGLETPVTNGIYSKVISTYKNQKDRKKAFEALYKSFDTSVNTYAAIYRALLQRDFANAQARGYKTTLEKALEPNNIPTKVYETLIKITKKNVAPLRRYIELRKKALGLAEYHYYDNQINIVDYDKEFSYDEAQKMVLESVTPLGKDYEERMKVALGAGWLDVFETPNKRSGAYSLGIYGVHPYMLLNYNNTMDAVYTLAHELGHTLHTMYSNEFQPYATHDYTIFVAEVASTFNERLLLDYMLKHSQDRNEKVALIEQALGNIVGTYYIQTLFADYEYQAHKVVEEGGAVTQDTLNDIMTKLFIEYFGDSVTIDELQQIIWARIPHFYNSPYYVYQYATSFVSSANLYKRITDEKLFSQEEREKALESYLNLLKSGGNDHPMAQLKKAGVDLEKEESFNAIAQEFSRLLDLLEELIAD
jgi:oligoendopeptidase F